MKEGNRVSVVTRFSFEVSFEIDSVRVYQLVRAKRGPRIGS